MSGTQTGITGLQSQARRTDHGTDQLRVVTLRHKDSCNSQLPSLPHHLGSPVPCPFLILWRLGRRRIGSVNPALKAVLLSDCSRGGGHTASCLWGCALASSKAPSAMTCEGQGGLGDRVDISWPAVTPT